MSRPPPEDFLSYVSRRCSVVMTGCLTSSSGYPKLTALFAISGLSGGASGRFFDPLKGLIGGLSPFNKDVYGEFCLKYREELRGVVFMVYILFLTVSGQFSGRNVKDKSA